MKKEEKKESQGKNDFSCGLFALSAFDGMSTKMCQLDNNKNHS